MKEQLVNSICDEINIRKDYLPREEIDSLYFGGGTPSLLEEKDLQQIFNSISNNFVLKKGAEITLEANPDDLNISKLKILKEAGINRLSIGIQSFNDAELHFMNRSHDRIQAIESIENALNYSFDISADLIFGIPGQTDEELEENINILTKGEIAHISTYALTVEPKTALHHFVKTGRVKETDQEKQAHQFSVIHDYLTSSGFDHYEISNYARDGKYAIHNSSYWKGSPYLGIGPAAHSFNGRSRSWNIANNPAYIRDIKEGVLPIETEILSEADQYNEAIMISLRTKSGLAGSNILQFRDQIQSYFKKSIKQLIKVKLVEYNAKADIYFLPYHNWMIADSVCRDLLFVED